MSWVLFGGFRSVLCGYLVTVRVCISLSTYLSVYMYIYIYIDILRRQARHVTGHRPNHSPEDPTELRPQRREEQTQRGGTSAPRAVFVACDLTYKYCSHYIGERTRNYLYLLLNYEQTERYTETKTLMDIRLEQR